MEKFKVLIVGAGASGIAAAARLLENGYSSFKIIEAENRIGGRVYSSYLDKTPIELGAEWIHGEQGNFVNELASRYNLTDNSFPESIFMETSFFDFFGNQINKDISVELAIIFHNIMSNVQENEDVKSLSGSIGKYFEYEFEKAVNNLKKKINIDDNLYRKFLKIFEKWENSIDGSHSWYETSLTGHLEYWECPGNLLTRWKNNCYATVFDLLSKKLPGHEALLPIREKIVFNKEVSCIKWMKECEKDQPNVEVQCLDGSVYFADHVLLTCSLGVLKERAIKMFTPSLPSKKLLSIQNLGFGTVDKIFIKFSHCWWKDDCDGFAFLWSEEEIKNDSSGWLSGVICFHPIDTESTVLRGWITAEAAQNMELLSIHEITQELNYLLDKFLGSKYSIPLIEACVTSNWHSNPHFRGSYSCRLVNSEKFNVWASDLAEPVCNDKKLPILLFGGEASHDHYFSTVHGAIEAGRREADRILSLKKPKIKKKYDVIIVGAGVSGLAAAKELIENGVSDVIVLEAQSEPGGRIRSILVDDYHLELGAQWIHGEKNDVFKLSQNNNLLTGDCSSEGEGLYLRENGEIVDEHLVREVDDVVKTILENCENYVSCCSENKDCHSIGHELLMKFNEYLDSCVSDSEKVKEIKKELLEWHFRFQLIDNSCSDLNNLSAKAWGLFKFCGGNDYINFKNGYSTLIDTLVEHVPKNSLILNCPVEKIDWLDEVKIKTSNDSYNESAKYCAKVTSRNALTISSQYVIVTSSLGCLKSNCKTMFNPSLPNYLLEAIKFLDFGVLNKIFLIYDEPWWEAGIKGFQLVWSEKELMQSKKHWGKYVTGFDVIIKNKPVLLGWVGGEGAKIVETLTEENVGREATELLQRFYRKTKIPFPRRVIRSAWWSNEYVKGGYSHITVKCDKGKINGSNLSQPVYTLIQNEHGEIHKKPTILLAGESTHKNYFSTVHGAFESGQNQARVVLEHIRSTNRQFSFKED